MYLVRFSETSSHIAQAGVRLVLNSQSPCFSLWEYGSPCLASEECYLFNSRWSIRPEALQIIFWIVTFVSDYHSLLTQMKDSCSLMLIHGLLDGPDDESVSYI